MTTHAYGRAHVVEDLGLAVVLALAALLLPRGPLSSALLLAGPAAVAWGVATLHFPSRVDFDDTGVTFSRYGRRHRFEWEGSRVRVRRFLVRDRVLVVIAPAPAWRGRYWIRDTIGGFGELVAALERRTTPR